MGFFITAQKDYSRKDDTWFVRYANRWRLECSDQKVGDLCVPKKPITSFLTCTGRLPSEHMISPTRSGLFALSRRIDSPLEFMG